MQQAPLVVLIVAGMLLSGCVGDDEAKPKKGAPPPVAEAPVTTLDTGSVKGQIYTVDLEPVVREQVGLIASGSSAAVATTTTDLQGRFTFNGIAPGGYRVHISALCCVEVLKEVVVTGNQVTEINFQVERRTDVDPYIEENVWEGFMGCGAGTPVVTIDICSFTGGTAIEDPNDNPAHVFNVTKGLRSLVVGMEWDAVGGVSGENMMLHIVKLTGDDYTYARPSGPSPLLANIDEEDVRNDRPHAKFSNIDEEDWDILFRVWTPWDTATATYQQPFTIHWHEYYHQLAAEDADPIPPQ